MTDVSPIVEDSAFHFKDNSTPYGASNSLEACMRTQGSSNQCESLSKLIGSSFKKDEYLAKNQ